MLPAIILAFSLSFPTLAIVNHYMVKNASGYEVAPVPSAQASMLALALGLFIPAVSAVVPIRRALSQNLNEAINQQRGKNSGALVKIFDSNRGYILPFVMIGGIAALGGSTIYYYLPKAFLSLDY